MAGMKRELTKHTKIALACVGVWACGLAWMWLDFHYGSSVWTITPGPILLMLAMALAVPVLLYCAFVWMRREAKGLPIFTREPPAESEGAPPA